MTAYSSISPSTPEALTQAAALLRQGKLVAFPTETVYGLGADATNDRAVAAIYAAKGRPSFNPLIAHIAEPADARALVVWNDWAERLAARFWPGPLTLVLPRLPSCPVSLLASAGLDSLAVRLPAHPLAQTLIRQTGRPIAAPSANAFGKLSPTQAEHVAQSLGGKVDLILDGGAACVGVESTVLDLTTDRPTLLRPGGVPVEALADCVGPVRTACHDDNAPKSPGMLSSHYAPNLPLRLNALEAGPDEGLLAFGQDKHVLGGRARLNLSPLGDLGEAAANLFAMLRELDQPGLTAIAVMPIPPTGLGAAINDRLARAATPRA